MTLDSASQIILDAAGGNFQFLKSGTEFARFFESGSDFYIYNPISDKDIKFYGNDGGTSFTALTLDMSAEGAATFNDSVTAGSDIEIRSGNKLILQRPDNAVASNISTDSTGAMILDSLNGEGFFFNNAGINAFKIDPINATFAGTVTANAGVVVDTITIDGSDIAATGSLFLDSDDAAIYMSDGGTDIGLFSLASQELTIRNLISDKDINFQGNDGGSNFTAFSLDMSEAGAAYFNSTVNGMTIKASASGDRWGCIAEVAGNGVLEIGRYIDFHATDGDTSDYGARLDFDGTTLVIAANTSNTGTAAFTGVVTANAGVVVDNITIDGTTLALSSGDLTLDVAGDIILNADGGDWKFQDGATGILEIQNDGTGNAVLITTTSDKDMRFLGNDGGSTITALTLDMSEAGAATFNGTLASKSHVITGTDNNAFEVKTDHAGNPSAVKVAGSGSINGISGTFQNFFVLNVMQDSGAQNSIYAAGHIKSDGNT
jgi:hypothetical protein